MMLSLALQTVRVQASWRGVAVSRTGGGRCLATLLGLACLVWAVTTEVAAQTTAEAAVSVRELSAEQVARNFVAAQDGLGQVSGRFQQLRTLRNVRRPIQTEGRFWFNREGRFRWQVEGEQGLRLLAVREPDGSVLVLEPERRQGERMPPERAAEAAGGLALMQPGTSSDWEQFIEVFRVSGGRLDERTGLYVLDLRLRDRRASMAVYRVLFHVQPEGGALMAFELFFRDQSSIFTRFFEMDKDSRLAPEVFEFDTDGYEIKQAQ